MLIMFGERVSPGPMSTSFGPGGEKLTSVSPVSKVIANPESRTVVLNTPADE